MSNPIGYLAGPSLPIQLNAAGRAYLANLLEQRAARDAEAKSQQAI